MTTKTIQHTPGPWEVYEGHDGHFGRTREAYITHDRSDGLSRITIARMIDCGYDNTDDARLIAASPRMADALLALAEKAYGCTAIDEAVIAEAYAALKEAGITTA